MRQRVTRAGAWFSVASALVAIAAFVSANNLVFLILAAMLATLLASGFISRLSLAGLAVDLVLPEHIAAGRKLVSRVSVRNLKRWMPSFSVHLAAAGESVVTGDLYFPAIPARSALEAPVELCFARRGEYHESGFRFSTRFPFGFAERRIHVLPRREIVVYPPIDPLPGFEDLLASLTGEIESLTRGLGHDFYRIRPYEALESARHVDWKATAHTGDLQIREFAREQEAAIAVCLDLDVDTGSEEWFERAVSCCAFLCWRMNERGTRLRLHTQRFTCRVPEEGDVYAILRYLATVEPVPGEALSEPDDDSALAVVLTTSPKRLAANGWDLARDGVRVVSEPRQEEAV